jgi:SNF2 family DNA or RNA helicase
MKRIVRLTDEQEKVYKQMKQLALAELNGKLVTTASVLTQLMRLHQITSGHFVANDGTTQILKNERLDELINVLNEIEGKAIIWAHYRYDIQVIVEALKKEFGEKSVVTYYGDTSQDDRQKAIRDIQDKDSPVRFLVGTPQTGGYGITLTGANTMIYYSNGYDLEKRQQSEARIDRIGQTRHMTYIDIICENTVDEKIVEALRKKVNIASKVMGEELKDWI